MGPPSASEIAAAYGLVATGPATRASERVWRLPTAQGEVAIKRYAPGHAARAEKEAGLLAHLATRPDARFRVQRLLRTPAGNAVWRHDGGIVMLTDWQAGRHRTYDTFTDADWRSLGASLAALHRALDDAPCPADTLRARLHGHDAGVMRRVLTDAQATPALREYAVHALRLIDQYHPGSIAAYPADAAGQPIHNDYNQFNYLFDGAGPPVILDWEAAIGAPREYELVRCMNHLPLESPRHARAFVSAYLAVRPLQPDRIAWAVDAATVQHGFKQWLIEGWRRDPAAFAERLRGGLRMNAMFDGARTRLIDFYLRCLDTTRGPRHADT